MKLPSLSYLSKNAWDAFLRFPLTVLSALLFVVIGIDLVEWGKDVEEVLPEFNVLLCAGLGISLYFCAKVIADKKGFSLKGKSLLNGFATLLLLAVYFSLPADNSTYLTALPYIKFAIYAITTHLLVSVVPFLFSGQLVGFWHYNKILFLRFLAAVLYSGFIYIGLVLALAALHLLFDVKIPGKLYAEIWITVACFFNTWFFVAGIPKDFEALETRTDYPKALRVFSQYVLLPLLALYLIILYAYGTKILLSWDWPKGVVSYLIICVSVLGILSFLLLHPYGEQNENAWIKKASRGYYFLLFPLLLILFMAIFMRLGDYGITINRYLVLFLGLWLSIVCLYTALGKTNIKFIPGSLATLLLLISFGPWGLFSVSERSQVSRLKAILETGGILEKGKIKNEGQWEKDSIAKWQLKNPNANQGQLNDSLHNEVWSILNYLDDYHGFSAIQGWYAQNLDSIVMARDVDKKQSYSNLEAEMYMRSLGLPYQKKYSRENNSTINFTAEGQYEITKVSGFDYFLKFERYIYNKENSRICSFEMDSISGELNYFFQPQGRLSFKWAQDSVLFDLEPLYNKLDAEYGNSERREIPQQDMTLSASNKEFELKLELHDISFDKKPPQHLSNISGYLLIKRRDQNK